VLANVTLDWQTVIVAICALLVLAFVAVVWLTRDPRSHHVRVGLFLERDDKLVEEDGLHDQETDV